jgi:hypothetical protein
MYVVLQQNVSFRILELGVKLSFDRDIISDHAALRSLELRLVDYVAHLVPSGLPPLLLLFSVFGLGVLRPVDGLFEQSSGAKLSPSEDDALHSLEARRRETVVVGFSVSRGGSSVVTL